MVRYVNGGSFSVQNTQQKKSNLASPLKSAGKKISWKHPYMRISIKKIQPCLNVQSLQSMGTSRKRMLNHIFYKQKIAPLGHFFICAPQIGSVLISLLCVFFVFAFLLLDPRLSSVVAPARGSSSEFSPAKVGSCSEHHIKSIRFFVFTGFIGRWKHKYESRYSVVWSRWICLFLLGRTFPQKVVNISQE